jgi:predicted RNase H-like HicB family nuclease
MKSCSFREYVHEVLKTAVYEHGDDLSCIVAYAGSLPGCMTQGETFEEARELLIDAVETWVLSALRDGADLPVVNKCFLAVAGPREPESACA